MTEVAAVTRTALVTLVLGFTVIHFDQMKNAQPSHFTCNGRTYVSRAQPEPEPSIACLPSVREIVHFHTLLYVVIPQLVNVSLVL